MRRGLAIAVWLLAAQTVLAAGAVSVNGPALSQRETGPSQSLLAGIGSFAKPENSLEARLFADAADGRLDEFSPLTAALVAGGIEDADTLRQYERKVGNLAEQLRRSIVLAAPPRQRAEAIFAFLHREVFYGGYDLSATDLRTVLDQGRYNCISATVLFNCLAGQCGLDCRGLEMPSHAMSRVLLADGPLDVETTCPRWFSMTDEEKDHPPVAVSGMIGAATTAADRTKAREVSPIQLAAMIYYNRGVDLLGQQRFAEAAAANAKALRLDPTSTAARGNFLATLNNWSIELGNRGQFADAVDLLREGLTIDATFSPFIQNYVHTHRQWAKALCRSAQFEKAIEVLSRAVAELPDHDALRQASDEVRRQWVNAAGGPTNSFHPSELPCLERLPAID